MSVNPAAQQTQVLPGAVVALGSNLGDSENIFRQALRQLEPLSTAPLVVSSFWRTSPVNCPPGSPPFLNAVALLQPEVATTPERLLDQLQQMERDFGRRPKVVLNEPRPLDLDLILFRTVRLQSPRLVLPHPRAHERRFVLAPLAEIGPDWVLPGFREPVRELLRRLQTDEEIVRLDPLSD